MRLTVKVKKKEIYNLLYEAILFAYIFIKLNMLKNVTIYNNADYVMLLVVGWRLLVKRKKFIRYSDYLQVIWYIVFFMFCYISRYWASNVLYAKQVLVLMQGVIITILVLIEYLQDMQRWERFLRIFVFACFTHGIYAVLSTPKSDFGTNLFGAATGYYFNNIAQIIAFGICVSVYLYYKDHNMLWWLVIGIMCAIIGVTGSRKAILMAVLGIIVFVLFSRQYTVKRIRQIILLILAIIGLYFFIMNNEFLYEQIGSRLSTVFAIFGRSNIEADFSTLERLYFIDRGWKLFLNNMLHGVGVNNFKAHVGGYLGTNAKYSHNNYIELLSGLGIIGFGIYYSRYVQLLVLSIKQYIRKKRTNTDVLILLMMAMLLVLEYGNVTYYFVQYQIILTIICSYLKLQRKLDVNGKK